MSNIPEDIMLLAEAAAADWYGDDAPNTGSFNGMKMRFASAICAERIRNEDALSAKDADIARLRAALEAISGYENLSAEEFRKSYPEFAAKIRKTSNDGQRASVICSHAYLALSALQPNNGSTS